MSRWLSVAACVVALPLLACLSDPRCFDPEAEYGRVHRAFLEGRLQTAQVEAEWDYQRSTASRPEWSRRFQLLEAMAMVWRGADQELLELFEHSPVAPTTVSASASAKADDDIQQLALEATSLTRLGRGREAAPNLEQADRLCAVERPSAQCGGVLLAHGRVQLTNGEFARSERTYRGAVEFGRRAGDRMLEGVALMNMATAVSKQDRHDEALGLYEASYDVASALGAEDLAQSAMTGEGWEYYCLGDIDRALTLQKQSAERAAGLGDTQGEIQALSIVSLVYATMGQTTLAEATDLKVITLARSIGHQADVANAAMDLAQLYITEGRAEDADRDTAMALSIIRKDGDPLDILTCRLLTGESAALDRDFSRAEPLLRDVSSSPQSQDKMRWDAEHALGNMYAAQGQAAAAEQSYRAALAVVEGARGSLQHEASQLPFLTNAARIYDDYIHFLVAEGRSDDALEAADWSRARTLQQGLGVIPAGAALKPPPLRAREIARRAKATLLFYWMGERQSYLWAVSPDRTTLVALPAKGEIVPRVERYRRTLLALKDPLRANNGQGDKDGRELYDMLVAPVASVLAPGRPVVLFTEGEMAQLNIETLLAGSPAPHYWIEDATVSSAPSIRLLAAKGSAAEVGRDRLLLFGNSLAADPALPLLPMAELEVHKVQARFNSTDESVFSGARATPLTYLGSKPEQFSYIHFVAHGTTSAADPLESAVILSRDNSAADSYKLYARDILRHPISARLVTISACNSSGTRFYAGEGVVGLSWAFLRAGAHNTISALWNVSDVSTPELMDRLYSELRQSKPPATALREAKLSLLHSNGNFSRPFYWAPFQLYSGR